MQIIFFYFIVSMLTTFIILYIFYTEPKVILKYPKIDQPLSDLYVDDKNICYRYKTKEIHCQCNK